jgi:ComF family protein
VIAALKYDPRPTIAKPLAARMREAGRDVLAGASLAVPVPLHRSRERTRGFNQARELARHLQLPMADVLVRTRRTDTQADLPAERRHTNVRGAFAVLPGPKTVLPGLEARPADVLKDRVVVLVDDVRTTGATLCACASALLDAGAAEVRALTAARAALR